MMHPHRPPHRKRRWVLPVGQQHLRSLNPTRRFRSRPRNGAQCTNSSSPIADSIARRRPATAFILVSNQTEKLPARQGKINPIHMTGLHEIDELKALICRLGSMSTAEARERERAGPSGRGRRHDKADRRAGWPQWCRRASSGASLDGRPRLAPRATKGPISCYGRFVETAPGSNGAKPAHGLEIG